MMTNAIQYVNTAATKQDAVEMLAALAIQVDYLGGRIMEPLTRGWWEASTEPLTPIWKVQVFFQDAPSMIAFPDGCRRVLVPSNMIQ